MPVTNDINARDVRLGVLAHFYDRFWSYDFLVLGAIGIVSLVIHLLPAIRHPATALHNGVSVFLVGCMLLALSLHKRRVTGSLRDRHIDKSTLGEMASVAYSLSMMGLIATLIV